MDLRCHSKILHGRVNDDGTIEFTCRSRWCGKEDGVVVVHKFNTETGEYTTEKYANPPVEEKINGAAHQGTSVRSARG